ncbi:MAG: PIN domain-containing protein [Actinomycetota bacterium]|jgi:toxin-antitoxin system PIN domain toxin|nr:PIN domain-containing protein [Actinomycetota bacterium]
MLVDANLLLYAVLERSAFHETAVEWFSQVLQGPRRVGLPWLSLGAFVRIATNPRATQPPLSPDEAWSVVEDWLVRPTVWIPEPTEHHADVVGGIIRRHQVAGNVVTDAQLAALALEHGLTVYSADSDFARFDEIRWENPVAP